MESGWIFVGMGGQKTVFEFNEKFVVKKYTDRSKVPYISFKNSNCASLLHILSHFLPHFVPLCCVPRTTPLHKACQSWLEEDLRCFTSLTVELKAKSPLPFDCYCPPWKDRFALSRARKAQGFYDKFRFLGILSTEATKENIKREIEKADSVPNNKYFSSWLAREKLSSLDQANNIFSSRGEPTKDLALSLAETLMEYRSVVCFLGLLGAFCEGQQDVAFEISKKLRLTENDFLSSSVALSIHLKLRAQKADLRWESVLIMQRQHKREGIQLLALKLENEKERELCKHWLRRFLAGRTACDCSLFITPEKKELKLTDFELKTYKKIPQWKDDYDQIKSFVRDFD